MSITARKKEYRIYWCGASPIEKGSKMERDLIKFTGARNVRICYPTNVSASGVPKYNCTVGLQMGANSAHAIATNCSTPIDPSWKESFQDHFPLYYWKEDGWHNLTPNYFLK